MKIAMAVHNGRISPVFDASRQALILDIDKGETTERTYQALSPEAPLFTVERLVVAGIRTLVCGAISASIVTLLKERGISVVPYIAGDIEDVIAAYKADALPCPSLLMPGCTMEQARMRSVRQSIRSRGRARCLDRRARCGNRRHGSR